MVLGQIMQQLFLKDHVCLGYSYGCNLTLIPCIMKRPLLILLLSLHQPCS